MRQNILAFLTASSLILSPMAFASGGGGFNTSGFSQKKVDQLYELGKSYYKARQANGTRLEYCVKNGDSLKKISRRALKPFKKQPASTLINNLYSCSNPSLKIADAVADDQGEAILHYLNKRFKLRLKNT